MKPLLGIVGRKSSGKDTVGEYLAAYFLHTTRLAFFDPGKQELAELFGGSVATIEANKANPKMRKMLQYYGTEVCRAEDPNYWIDRLRASYAKVPDNTVVFVTDCRYLNEAQSILEMGGVLVRVFRPSADDIQDGHASETEMSKIKNYQYMIQNDANLGRLRWYCKILANDLKQKWNLT